tara:strand:- start:1302 stop:1820 length:519 start_codon:yes stop_codon:yes gene_type:complete
MIKLHYGALFEDDAAMAARAGELATRTWELVSFLTDVRGVSAVGAAHEGSVTYHDGCSGLRELGIEEQPRRLLATIPGLELRQLPEAEICCGFGGTFCVKYPEISTRVVDDKAANIETTGAGTVLAGDLGCLLNIAGRLHRRGAAVRARHVAEVLAGMDAAPAIGEPGPGRD